MTGLPEDEFKVGDFITYSALWYRSKRPTYKLEIMEVKDKPGIVLDIRLHATRQIRVAPGPTLATIDCGVWVGANDVMKVPGE